MAKRQTKMFGVVKPVRYDTARKTIVVLGAPRGGTSMLSGALDKLGVYMGDNIGHQKEDPRFREETPLETKLETIAKNNEAHQVWGWKLPNTIYYYPEVHRHLVNPVFLTIYRNPFSVATSSARHDNRDLEQALLRVPIDHYAAMHRMMAQFPDVPLASCSFDAVSHGAGKDVFIDELIAFLGLSVTPEQRAGALDFIDYDKGYQD